MNPTVRREETLIRLFKKYGSPRLINVAESNITRFRQNLEYLGGKVPQYYTTYQYIYAHLANTITEPTDLPWTIRNASTHAYTKALEIVRNHMPEILEPYTYLSERTKDIFETIRTVTSNPNRRESLEMTAAVLDHLSDFLHETDTSNHSVDNFIRYINAKETLRNF